MNLVTHISNLCKVMVLIVTIQTGVVINSTFTDIGNDAMDFSGSISELSEISIDGVGDKAISAGEMSKISGETYLYNKC